MRIIKYNTDTKLVSSGDSATYNVTEYLALQKSVATNIATDIATDMATSVQTSLQEEIAQKADNTSIYTKEEVNELVNTSVNIDNITTTESDESGGNNTVTITLTNGASKSFNVKNGKNGADGVSLGEIALTQDVGDASDKVMSQKAVSDLSLRRMNYNNYAVFANAQTCTSVDTYNIDELKVITSLWVTDSFGSNGYSCYHASLKHILSIVSVDNPTRDFLSIYCEGYHLYLRFRKDNNTVLNYDIGNYYFNNNKIIRLFSRIDLYGKKIALYGKDKDGNIITIIDNYDISGLDLSNLQNIKIATTMGTSHNARVLFNHIQINNYIVTPETELNTEVNFGMYNTKPTIKLQTKPTTPATFKFTNESNTSGITVVTDEPLHKVVEVDRDDVALVSQVGFYSFTKSPIQSNAYEIFKVKFTNVESDLLIRGWSENGGSNYIIDPDTYEYTKIPMNASTGTVLEYPIVEGKTYFIIYALGNGYSTRYNHYFGGHYTMEITEPTIYCTGAMNLCGEFYDGKYFCGHIPFMSEGNFVPDVYGQFDSDFDLPHMKGRMRFRGNNIQMWDGSAWKQINNS